MKQVLKKQPAPLVNVEIPVDFPITKCPVDIANGAKEQVTTYTREDVRRERAADKRSREITAYKLSYLKALNREISDEHS